MTLPFNKLTGPNAELKEWSLVISRSIQPAMSPAEVDCYGALLDYAQSIVEFGSGGSTLHAVTRGVARIVSVESDPAWIARLRGNTEIVAAEKEGRLTLIHADVGPVTSYGAPADTSMSAKWPDYALAPWHSCSKPDIVLVDGRFRVACIAQAALHCKRAALIAVHDFWKRPAYHEALRVLEWVSTVESFCIFRPRPWSAQRALDLFERYRFTPL